MKSATDIPEIGRTVVKTTETRVVPSDPLTGERKTPDFWEYLESLTAKNWEKFPPHLRHKLYIYRRTGETGSGTPLERLEDGVFPLFAGEEPVPLNNREDFECGMAKIYGGGTYRLLLKRGSERITEGRINIDGAPKATRPRILDGPTGEASSNGSTGSNGQTGESTESVAKTAMNIVANQESQGLQIGMAALHSAADVVQRLSQPPAPVPAPGDDLTRQLMQAMIVKLLNPPDPLEQFKTFATLMSTLGGGGIPPTLQKIMDAALERFGNPVPPGSTVSTGAALVSQLPQIAGYVTEAVREWRVGSEAQLHTAQIMASQGRPPALPPGATGTVQTPAHPASPAPGRPITQATQIAPPAPEVQVMPAGSPSLEFIEGKIVEILLKPLSADDAADEVLSFLDLMAPTMVDQLAGATESQLVQLFQTRPVLSRYHDLARLQEFVRSFLKFANEAPPDGVVPPSTKPN